MQGWKIYTHDWRPPIQGGEPVLTTGERLPLLLPPVQVDVSDQECAAGYNFVAGRSPVSMAAALRIAGLWPDGRPSHIVLVETGPGPVVTRAEKSRAATLTILREATADELRAGIAALSQPFGTRAEDMAEQQLAWRDALGRPQQDEAAVEAGLSAALLARGLGFWHLRRFDSARAARAAWDARDAGAAWAARDAGAAWAAWDAGAAWAAWDARDARAAWAVWNTWDAGDAWDAWDAGAALIVHYASRQGWTAVAPDLLTVGLREAYAAGLGLALPTGPNELGWAMVQP